MDVLLKGLVLGLLLSIAVGPILFSIIKQSINSGIKGGLAFVLGVSASDISLAVASNFFTEVFSSLLANKALIGSAGAVLLIGIGTYFLFFKKVKVTKDGEQVLRFRKRDWAKIWLTGFLMNTLNPLIIGFWLTTSTSFAGEPIKSRALIFGIALGVVLTGDVLKVLGANKLRQRLTVHNIQLISRINGIILIGFGAVLLYGLLTAATKLPAHP